jgi:glycosyltransferase involved in cell wall biosynthesis
MSFYLGVFATHPIQYHAPLWRKLSGESRLRLKVHYASDFSVRGEIDPDFGVPVQWDTPLLDGYPYKFLRNISRDPLPANKGFFSVNCPQVEEVFQSEPFDAVLVHGYSRLFEWQIFRSVWRHKVPILLRGDNREGAGLRRNPIFEGIRGAVLRRLYRRIDVGLAVGSYMRRHFVRNGMEEHRVYDCVHCVDTDQLGVQRDFYRPMRDDLRRRNGIPQDALVLVISGKLIPRKAPLLIADAIRHMGDSGRVWVLILGDGPLRADVENGFRGVLGRRMLMPGFVNQSEIGRYYAMGDVLVMASSMESWGLVVNEAMLFGLPAVVTDRFGCREDLVLDGSTGFVYPSGNAAALAAILERLVISPSLVRKMSAAAETHIQSFSADRAVDGILQALDYLRLKRGWSSSHSTSCAPNSPGKRP